MEETDTSPALFQNKEFEKTKLVLDTVGHKFTHIDASEPLLIQGTHILLPISLLKSPEVFKSLFTMEIWNLLEPHEKFYLLKFLPCEESGLATLLEGKSWVFNQELEALWQGIEEGKFHPDAVMQRHQIEFLKRKLEQFENVNKRPKV